MQSMSGVAIDKRTCNLDIWGVDASQWRRRRRQDHDAGILFGKPEDLSRRKVERGIDGETSTPNAVGCDPSAFGGRRPYLQM